MENRIAEKWKIGWAETWKIGWAEEQTREVRKVTVGVIGPLSKNMQAYTYRAGRKIKINAEILDFNNSLDSFFSTTI